MKLQKARFHFVGIGGIGMCGLAELLHNLGVRVSGSDVAENSHTERLKALGVIVHQGHRAEQVGEADVVVYSSAINAENPEIREARARGIPLIPRAEALAEIMRLKRGIAVAGTHGKTTTTSMTASILLEAKKGPTIFVGGRFDQIQSTAFLGDGEWMVAEADESDGSFHKLAPEIAIITNIDSDHLDHFKSFENLQKAFVDFALKVPFYGLCIICGDDPRMRQIFETHTKRLLFYGFDPRNDLVLQGENGSYDIIEQNGSAKPLGRMKLNVPGRHNALNALAAFAAARAAGVTVEEALRGLAKFGGVDRRFHFKGEKRGIAVYDDYGHHPTEVRAVLQAFKEKYPDRRLVVYFQPHRFSRTQHSWHDFLGCFVQADKILLTDIYPAGETPIPGITGEKLTEELKHDDKTYFVRDADSGRAIAGLLREGDVFVTLGAGDGWKLGLDVLKQLG
ncbi:MAG: UDP-N-acetylmuramate--L-alanine ligase [Bdellovibrionaceae bacterium]|nr:UDP-N-acetylmuramate--L-alanine ligase [Pseudobdellovibrionaceae bacterium]MBX3032551.1 UDP-N-acetylmuramate--L-alanine ligase [Pseudobdellovibrionaceae bacterium]